MKTTTRTALALLLSLAVLIIASGCAGDEGSGPLITESRSVATDNVTAAHVRLNFGAGTFALTGGAHNLMEADFAYSVPKWKPEVAYTLAAGEGTLLVQQRTEARIGIGAPTGMNRWDLRLNGDIPINLDAHLGAGAATLALGKLNLTDLTVAMGAGTTTLDFTGAWRQNLDARLQGGVGDMIVHLPTDVGVRVVASKGIGNVSAPGLRHVDGAYVNDVYGVSPVTLTLTMELGVGSVVLQG